MNIKRAVTVILIIATTTTAGVAGVVAVAAPVPDPGVVRADTHWGTPSPQPPR